MKKRHRLSFVSGAVLIFLFAPAIHGQTEKELLQEIRSLRDDLAAMHREIAGLRTQLQAMGGSAPANPSASSVPSTAAVAAVASRNPVSIASGGPEGTGGNVPFLTLDVATGPSAPAFPATAVAFTTQASYLQPFGHDLTRFGVQLDNRYISYPNRHEDQADVGAILRLGGQAQTGLFMDLKHTDPNGVPSGATLGQTALMVDFFLPPHQLAEGQVPGSLDPAAGSRGFGGKVGFFATSSFLDDRTASTTLAVAPPSSLLVRSLQQFGIDTQLGWTHWGRLLNPVIDVDYAYLRQRGPAYNLSDFFTSTPFSSLSNRQAGSIRLLAPVSQRVAFTMQAGWNPTLIRADRTAFEILFGLRVGSWPLPWQFRGQRRPAPMQAPPIRYELLGANP